MKNLKIWQKLLLLGAIFLVPFAFVTYKMVSSINILGVEFAQQEMRGLDYYLPLNALLKDLLEHRGIANAWLSGDTSFGSMLTAKNADLEKDIAAVEETDERLGESLNTSEKWSALRDALRDLLKATPNLAVVDSFQQHTKLIEDAITLIANVGDTSNLTLDPDIDSYYLINLVIFQEPELSELLAQGRAIGSGMAARKSGAPAEFEELKRLSALAQVLQRKIEQSIGKALEFNAELRLQLEAPAAASSAGVEQGAALLSRLATTRFIDPSAQTAYAAMSEGVDSIFTIERKAADVLRGLLIKRVSKFRNEVLQTLAWAFLGLLLVSAIGYFIMRDITVPLREVVGTANQIATGDLSVRAELGSRKDEIGELAQAFDLMISRLSGLLGDVHNSGLRVTVSTSGIAATTKEQQATASQIATTTTEIGATSKEISATARELVQTMNAVATVAEGTATLAGQGQASLSRMEETMHRVMGAAGSVNADLAVLNEKAGSISQVVAAITKVADQTNLLSLNAAIEAEKAGEYGRGFSAVAAEVRRLADQTALATHDIEQTVKEIQSAVTTGVMGMDKFTEEVRRGVHDVEQVGAQLSQIIQQVQALVPRIELANEGMHAQAMGAEQISEALLQLMDAARHTADSLTQSASAIDELNQVSGNLRGNVSRFRLADAA